MLTKLIVLELSKSIPQYIHNTYLLAYPVKLKFYTRNFIKKNKLCTTKGMSSPTHKILIYIIQKISKRRITNFKSIYLLDLVSAIKLRQ